MKKLIIVIVSLVLVLIISLTIVNLTVMRNLKTDIVINAPSEAVWNILMDHESYPTWNPFIKQISGTTQPGKYLSVELQAGTNKPMQFKPVVITNSQGHEFRWKGKLFVKGIFDGEHYFIVEPVGSDQTRFIHGENFTGILSGLMLKMIEEDTLAGFQAMNTALKNQAEKK